jgi:hypothetical protein
LAQVAAGAADSWPRAAENEKQKAAQNKLPVKKRRARVILWVERMQI